MLSREDRKVRRFGLPPKEIVRGAKDSRKHAKPLLAVARRT
jgi:hypothetical protein